MKKRFLSLAIALCLCVGLLPEKALAATPVTRPAYSGFGVIAAGTELRRRTNYVGYYYYVDKGDGKLKEAVSAPAADVADGYLYYQLQESASDYTLTVTGRVELPTSTEDIYGLDVYMPTTNDHDYAFVIQGDGKGDSELIVPGGIYGRKNSSTYSHQPMRVEIKGCRVTIPEGDFDVGSLTLFEGAELDVANGTVCGPANLTSTGTFKLTGNSVLTGKTLAMTGQQFLVIGEGASAAFETGSLTAKPYGVELHGTLSIADDGVNRLKFLNPMSTEIFARGHLFLGGQEMDMDPATKTFVPFGTVDRKKVDYTGLDLTLVQGNDRFTTDNGWMEWNAATKTLTMNNVSLNRRVGADPKAKGTILLPAGDVTIDLRGKNVLTTLRCGIDATACSSLTINGPGELVVNLAATGNVQTFALQMGAGELILNSGTLRVPDPKGTATYYGIDSGGKVTVRGGELQIAFPATRGTAIKAMSAEISGGVVNLSGSEGLNCTSGGPINISGGTTTIAARITGVYASSTTVGDFTMSGGTLNVSITNAAVSAALHAYKSISITGGDITAKGIGSRGALCSNKENAISYANVVLTAPAGGGAGNYKSWSYILQSDGSTISTEAAFTSNARYALTVNSDGAGSSGSGSYAPGSAAVINAGSKAGYLFDGWELTGGGRIENADSARTWVTLDSGDATVTARWAPSYTVTFSGAGSNPTGSGTYKAGDTVTIFAGSKNGYNLEKWSCDDPDVVFADPTSATTSFIMPAKDVTVTATWAKSTYTVTLEGGGTGASGGGTYAAGETVTINAGTKPNGVFSRWTGAGVSFTSATSARTTFVMPAASVTVTANWNDAYQVNVVSQYAQNVSGGGTYEPGTLVTVNAGRRTATTQANVKVEMVLDDWSAEPQVTLTKTGDKTVQFIMPNHDVTLTANWVIPSYTVTFEGTGTGGSRTGTYEVGSYVDISAGTREHYTFAGWRVNSQISAPPEDAASENTRFIMPGNDVTVTANWTQNKYRLKILEGGSNPSPSPYFDSKYTYGERVNIYAGVNDGYEFDHWSSDNGGTFADPTKINTTFTMPGGEVNLTAHWVKEEVPSLFITLSTIHSAITVNGQRYEDTSLHLRFEPGTTVTLEPENLIGFRGWGASDGTLTLTPEQQDPGNPVLTFVMPDHYVRLYANWWKMAFLEIQDVGDGGSEGDYYKEGDAVAINAGTMPGKTFLYWEEVNRDADNMGSRRFADHRAQNTTYTMPEGFTIIRATWLRNTDGIYTLLVKDGGTGASVSGTYAAGDTVTVSAGQREEEAFAFWDADGVTLDDDKADTVSFPMPAGDVTLRAYWNQSGEEVTLLSPGTGASGGGFYGPGRTVNAFAGERRGYHFDGWEVSPESVSLSDPADPRVSFPMPEVPVTLTAKWAPNVYTLTVEGLEGGTRTEERSFGEMVSVDAGERAGYAFAEWHSDVQGLLTDPESRNVSFPMPDSDVTLTAAWVNAPDETGALTLYLDDFVGDLIIEEDHYRDGGTGVDYPFSGPYILTQHDPSVPTSNQVTIRWFDTDGDFDVTLKNVNLAADSGEAAVRIENAANVELTLLGKNTLTGGAGHAGIELVSTGGSPDTTLTIHGTDQDSLTVTGGENGAGIGGSGGYGYGTVKIDGGMITARGGADAAGIGGSASGGSGNVEISGGTVAAIGGGSVPAIGGADRAHITLSGGSVTAESEGAAMDVGTVSGNGTVRLGNADGTGGGVRVTVSGPDRIGGKPAVPVSAGEEHNYYWNGILFEGDAGTVYRGEYASNPVSFAALEIPQGKTLYVPEGVILQVPREKLQESGKSFRGEGWVLLGEDYHYITPEGALAPCEARLNGFTVYPTLRELLTGELDGKPLLYGDGNHVRLLADVSYPEDILFSFETARCFEVELDLNGKTLDMGGHGFVADVAYHEPVERNYFLISDTSANGGGRLVGDSVEPLLRTRLGLLVIRGGTFLNNGSGPALRIENARPETRLEGGTFSQVEVAYKGNDGKPIPLSGFLGDGCAFFDEARQAWISPASKASTLTHVRVDRPSGALADLSLTRADGRVSVLGAEGKQISCRWFARPYGTEDAAEIKDFRQDTLKLDGGVIADGSYYLSCVVTVDGQDVLTDEIFAEVKAAEENSGGGSSGSGSHSGSGSSSGSGSNSGSASKPASPQTGDSEKTEEPKVTVTVDGKAVRTEEKDGVLILDGGPFPVAANGDQGPMFSISIPGKAKVRIPLTGGSAGTVAVLVREDGGEEPVRLSAFTGDALVLQVDGDAAVKLVDRAVEYDDVDGHWAKRDGVIDFVTSREIFRGMGETLFAPDRSMTRAMMVTALHRLSGEAASQGESGYTDVSADAWYAGAVNWATGAGIVNGVGNGRFDPEEPVSRENLCLMVYRLARNMGCTGKEGSLDGFSDGEEVHPWAAEAMSWCVGSGILHGRGKGALCPRQEITRAETAAVFQRLVELILAESK